MFNKRKTIAGIVFSALIVIIESIGFVDILIRHGSGVFIYYTQLSNMFLLIVSVVWIIMLINQLKEKRPANKAGLMLKYLATCTVAQTFFIVIFVLTPTTKMGFSALMFSRDCVVFHTVGPLLAMISFIFFDHGHTITMKDTVIALIPTLAYAAVAIPLNILRIWHGPYPFLYVHEQSVLASYIWAIVVLGCAYLIALVLRIIKKKLQ